MALKVDPITAVQPTEATQPAEKGDGSFKFTLASQVEERLKTVDKPITVAVMGCAVNGPGEASAADCGIAGGVGEGLLFRKGEIVKKVPQDRLVDELFALIEEL